MKIPILACVLSVLLGMPLQAYVSDSSASASLYEQISQKEAPDTLFRLWHYPFFGFGAGWALGSMSLFDEWADGIYTPPYLYIFENLLSDTSGFTFSEKEKPSTYNSAFPLEISFSPVTRDYGYLSSSIGFQMMKKTFKGSWTSKTSGNWVNTEKEIVFSDLSVGASYHHYIPREYFSIDNIEQASFVAGISFSPLSTISLREKDESNVVTPGRSTKETFFGFGLSWQAGLSTLKTLSSGNGLEAGLVYDGNWFGMFNRGGRYISMQKITPLSDAVSEKVSFTCHRFKIYLQVLIGKKQEEKAPESPPPQERSPVTGVDKQKDGTEEGGSGPEEEELIDQVPNDEPGDGEQDVNDKPEPPAGTLEPDSLSNE